MTNLISQNPSKTLISQNFLTLQNISHKVHKDLNWHLKSKNLISHKLQGVFTPGLNVVKRYCRLACLHILVMQKSLWLTFFSVGCNCPRVPSPLWPLIKLGKGSEDPLRCMAWRHRSKESLNSTGTTANDAGHTCNHPQSTVWCHAPPAMLANRRNSVYLSLSRPGLFVWRETQSWKWRHWAARYSLLVWRRAINVF